MITITINTDNAAFHDEDIDRGGYGQEVGRILLELGEAYQQGHDIPSTLRDINGNAVGKVRGR